MKQSISVAVVLSLVLTLGTWMSVPKVMAVDLVEGQDGVYVSELLHLPVRIGDVTLEVSVLMNTYLQATLEFRVGEDYVRFHLDDLSVTGHYEYDILELFAKVTHKDVTLRLYIDTDGIVQGSPRVVITYYGLF